MEVFVSKSERAGAGSAPEQIPEGTGGQGAGSCNPTQAAAAGRLLEEQI